MKKLALFLLVVAAIGAVPAMARAQGSEYPIIVIPTGKGPFTFPAGYTTPWDKVEIRVTEKMSPNLFVLHGSQGLDPSHPDASGGRAMALFGPDGVLMVDTENRQVAEKTLAAIRSFTKEPIRILVNTHIHPDHTGANAFFAKQGALIYAQENLRNEMLRPPSRGNVPPASATVSGVVVDILAKVKALREQGKTLKDVLAANLTGPYDATTQGDTQQSKDRFITAAFDEVKDFPPVVDGKRTMPTR